MPETTSVYCQQNNNEITKELALIITRLIDEYCKSTSICKCH